MSTTKKKNVQKKTPSSGFTMIRKEDLKSFKPNFPITAIEIFTSYQHAVNELLSGIHDEEEEKDELKDWVLAEVKIIGPVEVTTKREYKIKQRI